MIHREKNGHGGCYWYVCFSFFLDYKLRIKNDAEDDGYHKSIAFLFQS